MQQRALKNIGNNAKITKTGTETAAAISVRTRAADKRSARLVNKVNEAVALFLPRVLAPFSLSLPRSAFL